MILGTSAHDDPVYLDNFEEFIARIESVLKSGMRLMLTSGGWLGMAHPHAREGDRAVYHQGCSVPVILREMAAPESTKSKSFTVVGGLYLYLHLDPTKHDACRDFVERGIWEEKDE